MKAKEYAARYLADPTDETLGKVAYDMLMEIEQMGRQRGVKLDAGFFAILNEIDNKWRAFVRLTNVGYLRPDGFEQLIKEKMNFAYAAWINYRMITEGHKR